MSWQQRRWLVSLVGMLLCLSCIETTSSKTARVNPANVFVEAGHSMKVTCTLQKAGIERNLSSADLVFSWYRKPNVTLIAAHYVTQPNGTTAALLLPNVPAEKDEYQLWCHTRQPSDMLDGVYVRVGYKPNASKVLSVTADNWQTVTVTWRKAINRVFRTTTNAYWKSTKDYLFHTCPNQHNDDDMFSCSFSLTDEHLDPSTYFQIKINSSNLLGTFTTRPEMKTFYLADINKPQGVRSLSVQRKGPDWMEVFWVSAAPISRKLVYAINSSCRDPQDTQVPATSERTILWNITHLQPGKLCRIAVAARSKQEVIWSDAKVIYEATKDSVPTGFPVTSLGGFDIRILSEKRKITLYWQPMSIEHRGGKITRYKITRVSKHSGTLRTYEDEVSAHKCCQHEMQLDMNEAYNISVKAATSVGYNVAPAPQQKVVVFPQALLDSQIPDNVTALITGANVTEVWWTLRKDSDYTGYWCEMSRSNDDMRCNGTVTWVAGISTPWTVASLPLSADRLRFGVSSDLDTSSSGIMWSDCVYDLKKKSTAPTVRSVTTSTGFNVYLKTPAKCSQRPGFIYAYRITYCKLKGTHCAAGSVTMKVPRTGKKTVLTVGGLPGNTEYQLTVHSVTAAGLSTNQRTSVIKTLTGVGTVINNNLAVIMVSCLVGLVFLVIGIGCCIRKCGKKCIFYQKKLKITFQLPEQMRPKAPDHGAVAYHNVTGRREGSGDGFPPYPLPSPPPDKLLPPLPAGPARQRPPSTLGLTEMGSEDGDDSGLSSMQNNSHLPLSAIYKGCSWDETSDQNKLNTELDNDYNFTPAIRLDTLSAQSGSRSTLVEDSSGASTSDEDSDVYKAAAVLLDPRVLQSCAPASYQREECAEDEDEDSKDLDYSYKPAFLSAGLLDGSSPLLARSPQGVQAAFEQSTSPPWMWDQRVPVQPVRLLLLGNELTTPGAKGLESDSERREGDGQALPSEEDSDDYGYTPVVFMASPI